MVGPRSFLERSASSSSPPPPTKPGQDDARKQRSSVTTESLTKPKMPAQLRENIWTVPNALTLARICATPVIGHFVISGELAKATALLFAAGVSDLVDGWLARKYNMGSVLGSILDPAADKLLMTTMVVALTMKSMLPLPLAVLIIGRDVALALSAFYFRYASLPPPKTFMRYWDFSIPSAEVKPTQISKYNTALQLLLVGATTVSPLLPFDFTTALTCLQYVVAGTTVWSGSSYLFGSGVRYIK
ncbi:hypothetical protein OIV83_001552 [Microbotryomycetes sp. JL201]|nr:hypothetical protein OIV83_001552 [Microbotryomycetes sp. JL201]